MSAFPASELVALSAAVAAVQEPRALERLLAEQVQPLLGFRWAAVVGQGSAHHRYLAVVGGQPLAGLPLEQSAYANENSTYAWLVRQLGSDKHTIFTSAQLEGVPTITGLLLPSNAADYLVVSLQQGTQVVGLLWLQYEPGQAPPPALLTSVADLLAVAVANLRTSAQVRQLQRQLLAPELGLARPRETIAQAIIAALREQLPFDCSCVVAYDQQMAYEWFYLGDLPPAITQDADVRSYYPQLRPRPDLAPDAPRREWLAEPVVMFNDREQLERIAQRGYPILNAALRAGLQESLFLHLCVGNQPVGGVFLYAFRAGHFAPYVALFPHLQRLLEPAAIGLSNGVAYEALQAADQEKAFQLALGQALTSSRTCPELFAAVAHQSATLIPWHFFAVGRLSDPRELFYLSTDAQGRPLPPQDREALRDAASLDDTSLGKMFQAGLPLYAAPGLYAGPACAAVAARYQLPHLLRRLFRLEALLCLPVPLPGGDAALFTLGSRHPYGLDEVALALLERLRPQIVLALQNQAAFTRIVALQQQLEREKTYLVEEIKTSQNFEEIVGSTSTLREVFQSIDQVAATTTTVLILGETGTGKELIARAIHHRSPRRERVLVKVNCAALPPQLIESELFGHEKGAFTGAIEQRIGKFELADGGTIFLDEIGELPLELQAKLLRVLQEREIERLGGKRVLQLDVRVVAATNRVLAEEVAAGRFRADLYYRLSVFPITLPPLRARRADIPLLVDYFGRKFSRRLGRPYLGLQPGCLEQLAAYAWPGNVRELENVVEHAVIVSQGQPLVCSVPSSQLTALAVPASSEAQTERARIEAVLQQTRWRIRGAGGAASLLGLKPTTLEARMKRLGIK